VWGLGLLGLTRMIMMIVIRHLLELLVETLLHSELALHLGQLHLLAAQLPERFVALLHLVTVRLTTRGDRWKELESYMLNMRGEE